MSKPDTICTDLQGRLDKFKTRYGYLPEKLPVTLDEWAWLGEWMAYAKALRHGSAARLQVPMEFAGVPLSLVARVVENADGSMQVLP